MSEKIAIASAKTAKDLANVYDKVKTDAKGYGFTSVSVIGRKKIKSVKDFEDAVMLAKNRALAKVAKQLLI